jgi:Dullard-like phosphatase family protein
MDNKQIYLIQNKNPPQNQNKGENVSCNSKYSDQNKNLNESSMVTSVSSVNTKKNTQHTNYKTPKKKNFPIPMPKPKNPKPGNGKNNPENKLKNPNAANNIIYTKGTIKKINNNANNNINSNNINDTNKIYGRSMSQISIEQDNNKKMQNNFNNNILPLMNNKNQLYSQLDINQNLKNKKNQSILNKKKLNVINEAINKDINSDINYFSNNEDDNNNNIINNTINHIENKILANDLSKKMQPIHRTILKEYDNKFSTGYYSESDQRKEKSAVLNIEEILMTEEKLSAVISCLGNGITCEEECFDWFNSYYHTALSNNIEKYFIKDEYAKIIRRAVNLNVFSLMLCYDISFNQRMFKECQYKLLEIMTYNHTILILISKYLSNKIIDRNMWVNKLEQLIMKYDRTLKNPLRIVKEIICHCNTLIKIIPFIINYCQNPDIMIIYNKIDYLSSQELYNIYRDKIHKNINQNGSILANSSYFQNNKTNVSIPVPYLANKSNKPYTLVLDLDETLIHFKANPNNEESGTIKIRPYLYQFLDNIKKYYELVVFTAATQEYADPIINALETNKKYFDYRLYRIHTLIIDNDFVKDISKLGRDLNKIIIVDNMEQNYKLQQNNGITIRPFWGKDNEDSALFDLLDILMKIAERNLDVRIGLKLFKEDIISKVTSNIFRRSQNRY